MSPLLDHLLVAAFVAGALAFFGVRFFRRKSKACEQGCCGGKKPLSPNR
jgi:hypothetical protein